MKNWKTIKKIAFGLLVLMEISSAIFVFNILCWTCQSPFGIAISLLGALLFGIFTGATVYYGLFDDKYSVVDEWGEK